MPWRHRRGSRQCHAPTALPLAKEILYPCVQKARRTSGRSGQPPPPPAMISRPPVTSKWKTKLRCFDMGSGAVFPKWHSVELQCYVRRKSYFHKKIILKHNNSNNNIIIKQYVFRDSRVSHTTLQYNQSGDKFQLPASLISLRTVNWTLTLTRYEKAFLYTNLHKILIKI